MQENNYFCNQIVITMGLKGIESVWICMLSLVLWVSCAQRKEQSIATPWGEILVEDGDMANDSTGLTDTFDLPQIQVGGELIAVTMSGPATCFDYKGKKLGEQYLLCNRFAEKMGVAVRVELCRDTLEMLRKVQRGEADLLMFQMPRTMVERANAQTGDSLPALVSCGAKADSCRTSWVVNSEKKQLIAALDQWYSPELVAQVRQEERYLLSANSVRRHVYAPMLNCGKGVISRYDHLFMTYSMNIRWDWRLMAAQCYQESTFDPRAKSWAGACGLMQIMPSTAELLGLPIARIYDPESNIEAASRYLAMLERRFSDSASSLCLPVTTEATTTSVMPWHWPAVMAKTRSVGAMWPIMCCCFLHRNTIMIPWCATGICAVLKRWTMWIASCSGGTLTVVSELLTPRQG